jgi:hypothetical protein
MFVDEAYGCKELSFDERPLEEPLGRKGGWGNGENKVISGCRVRVPFTSVDPWTIEIPKTILLVSGTMVCAWMSLEDINSVSSAKHCLLSCFFLNYAAEPC